MKIVFKTAILLFSASILFTACHKKDATTQIKSNGLPKAGATTAATNGTVAVIDIDSLANNADFCKKGQEDLMAKQKNYQNQLNSKGQALQKAMADFQQKAQSGAFTTQAQGEAAQNKIIKQQQALQSFQEKIEKEMAEATDAYQKELRAKLQEFLKEYNADGRFKVIISKSGDNVLYTDPSVDITKDVIVGLNKKTK